MAVTAVSEFDQESGGSGQRESRSSGASQEERRHRVLVVDDNADAAVCLAMLLRHLGHDVRTAGDGLEAVAVAAQYHPTIMILDIGLPRLNGYDVARQVRTLPDGDKLMLIALTGCGEPEDIRLAREAGFNVHVVKPLRMVDLKRLIADGSPGDWSRSHGLVGLSP
jgi:CheY-like chemotaxis protein